MADNEVSANLAKLSRNLGPQYLYPAMTKACAVVRNEAINKAPQKTGNLKRSIDFKVERDGTEGVIFSNARYAPYVEVGTGMYAKKGGRDTPWVFPYYDKGKTQFARTSGIKAQPFLEPAIQENNSRIKQCFEGLF